MLHQLGVRSVRPFVSHRLKRQGEQRYVYLEESHLLYTVSLPG